MYLRSIQYILVQYVLDTTLQKKSLLARIKCPRKNSNIVAKSY